MRLGPCRAASGAIASPAVLALLMGSFAEGRARMRAAGTSPRCPRLADGEQEAPAEISALQPILELLDASIQSRVPGPQYAMHRKRPHYGLPDL